VINLISRFFAVRHSLTEQPMFVKHVNKRKIDKREQKSWTCQVGRDKKHYANYIFHGDDIDSELVILRCKLLVSLKVVEIVKMISTNPTPNLKSNQSVRVISLPKCRGHFLDGYKRPDSVTTGH
jgi:hypothetical protein